MSENEKNNPPGELISEDQLDAVSGGSAKYGTVSNPKLDATCWFRGEGESRKDGRTRCVTECKGVFENGCPVPWENSNGVDGWYICHCWGTDYCIDKWHWPCGKPARTAWK